MEKETQQERWEYLAKVQKRYSELSYAYDRLIRQYHESLDREERLVEENKLYSLFIRDMVRVRNPKRTV
jgi:hypothetical protein